jgi:hypothetical protein
VALTPEGDRGDRDRRASGFAIAGQRQLAQILGADEAKLARAAQAFEAAEGIVDGEAFARLHAPGFGRLRSP